MHQNAIISIAEALRFV